MGDRAQPQRSFRRYVLPIALPPGTHTLGPESGRLTVRTGKAGAAAKAGHDLLIEVGSWSATVEAAPRAQDTTMLLSADARSLRVLEGTGGMGVLGEDDKRGIAQTIDEEVLRGTAIEFRSTAVTAEGEDRLSVEGELELSGRRHPVAFALAVADGRLRGSASIRQSDWGMKPYSALFGTLKVSDEVVVEIDAAL